MTPKEFTVWLAGFIDSCDRLGHMNRPMQAILHELKMVEDTTNYNDLSPEEQGRLSARRVLDRRDNT